MWELFEDYANSISLFRTFILQNEISDKQQADIKITGSFIESDKTSYIFRSVCHVTQMSELPQGFQVNIQPGQIIPLIPGFPKRMELELKDIGWIRNEEGI